MNLLAEGMGRCWWGSDRVSPSQTPDFNANVPSFMGNIGNGEEVGVHTDEDVFEEAGLRGGEVGEPATHRDGCLLSGIW
jgi:hypothetical protein